MRSRLILKQFLSERPSWENMIKDQSISHQALVSFIPITFSLGDVSILLGCSLYLGTFTKQNSGQIDRWSHNIQMGIRSCSPVPNESRQCCKFHCFGMDWGCIRLQRMIKEKGLNTRYVKDSLAYRGAVFQNTISLNKPGFSHRNQNELYTID